MCMIYGQQEQHFCLPTLASVLLLSFTSPAEHMAPNVDALPTCRAVGEACPGAERRARAVRPDAAIRCYAPGVLGISRCSLHHQPPQIFPDAPEECA